MNSLKWMLSHLGRQCPARKLGSFKFLQKLNGKKITLYDIFRTTGVRDKNKYLMNEIEERTKQKMIKFEKEKYERSLKSQLKLPQKNDEIFTEHYWFKRFSRRIEKLKAESEPLLFITLVKSDEDGINPGIKSENLEAIKSIANMRADIHKGTKKVKNLIDKLESGSSKEESLNKQSVFLKLSMALDNTNHYRRFMRKKDVF